MRFEETRIKGCYEITADVHRDDRGIFVKPFHNEYFKQNNLQTEYKEEYFSTSFAGVLRGLHFQLPPYDHVKLVYCISGTVLDAVVDLRKGSPTYGEFELFELSPEKGNIIYIPIGMAHGFYVLSKEASMVYNVSEIYSSQHDSGIKWDSVGIPWPNQNPTVSVRDKQLTAFSEFNSPFEYSETDVYEK